MATEKESVNWLIPASLLKLPVAACVNQMTRLKLAEAGQNLLYRDSAPATPSGRPPKLEVGRTGANKPDAESKIRARTSADQTAWRSELDPAVRVRSSSSGRSDPALEVPRSLYSSDESLGGHRYTARAARARVQPALATESSPPPSRRSLLTDGLSLLNDSGFDQALDSAKRAGKVVA